MSDPAGPYPRPLTPLERELALWVLPAGAAGYAALREFVERSVVIGEGRRGEGEIILGAPGDTPDLGSPLPQVVSFGIAGTGDDTVSVTVREILDGQMSVEIVGTRSDRVPEDARIVRRWTYAEWLPGKPCPQCGAAVREVEIARSGPGPIPAVLAICPADRRLWVHGGPSGVCRPVPVTNYYNELMLRRQIRDPATALDSSKLFARLGEYSDADLAAAFTAYNRFRAKVDLPAEDAAASAGRRGVIGRVVGFLFRR
jgi:hypothetical protein